MDFFKFFWCGVIIKLDYFRGPFLYILGLLRTRYRTGIFFGAAKFQIFLGMPDIPDFFCGGGGDWG